MIDITKRKTLKMISATGLSVAVAKDAFALLQRSDAVIADKPGAPSIAGSDLTIQVLSTTAVPGNSVMIVNRTDSAIKITDFLPGNIAFADKLVDLNSVLNGQGIVLPAHNAWAKQIEVWQLLAQPVTEYVWAGEAIENISSETEVVSLSAFMADTQALVSPAKRAASVAA